MLQENEQQASSSSILLFLAGGLVGAGIALLYAPLTGIETRKYIGIQKDRTNSKVSIMIENLRGTTQRLIEETRSTIDKAIVEGAELTKVKRIFGLMNEVKKGAKK